MTKRADFDLNGPASSEDGIFGLPFSEEESKIVLIPVPWEATTSYGGGTSRGPEAILEASRQVDLYDIDLGNFFEAGIYMRGLAKNILALNREAKAAAQSIIKAGGVARTKAQKLALKGVNDASQKVNAHVLAQTREVLKADKIPGIVGGDHSVPFGSILACLEKFPEMGVLHFDAHCDLREAYEGFEHSHASIFYNVLNDTPLRKLVQVGIRDFCEAEKNFAVGQGDRVKIYFDQQLADRAFEGGVWREICDEIVAQLPHYVYISFDIDGLDPVLCPHTGTPVPGGLQFHEAVALFKAVVRAGKQIVGFDLNEVSPGPDGDEWDANVGARLLFKMCGWALESQKK